MSQARQIIPFSGVDEVRFGMTREEVAEVAGPADAVRNQRIRRITHERRGATEYEFPDDTGLLRSITIFKPGRGKEIREQLDGAKYVPALCDGVEVLDKRGFQALFERERTVEGLGNTGVLFPELGILVAGFRRRVSKGRYVLAFPRERLEHYQENWLTV